MSKNCRFAVVLSRYLAGPHCSPEVVKVTSGDVISVNIISLHTICVEVTFVHVLSTESYSWLGIEKLFIFDEVIRIGSSTLAGTRGFAGEAAPIYGSPVN